MDLGTLLDSCSWALAFFLQTYINKRPRGLDALLGHLLVKEYQKCKNLGLRLAVSVIQHVQGQ